MKLLRVPFGSVVLAFLFVALAGCLGGGEVDGGQSIGPQSVSSPEGTGTIVGTVVDDAMVPLAGAMVGIQEKGLVSTTDEAGAFSLPGVDPGTYTLAAQRLGYSSAAQRVQVMADQVVELTFTLTALAIVDPYIDVQSWVGYLECQVGTSALLANCVPIQNVLNQYNLPNPTNTKQIAFWAIPEPRNATVGGLYEMEWERSTGFSGQFIELIVETENSGLSSQTWGRGAGESPVRVPVESNEAYTSLDPENPENDEVQTRAFADGATPPNIVFMQEFTVWQSVFYHANPGPAYTALADV